MDEHDRGDAFPSLGDSMGWLGLDDTDSLAGGCTTEVFDALLRHLPKGVYMAFLGLYACGRSHVEGRGNAAVAVEITADQTDHLMEHLDAWWTTHLAPLDGSMEASVVSDREQHPASPGMVWFEHQLVRCLQERRSRPRRA